MNFIFSGN